MEAIHRSFYTVLVASWCLMTVAIWAICLIVIGLPCLVIELVGRVRMRRRPPPFDGSTVAETLSYKDRAVTSIKPEAHDLAA